MTLLVDLSALRRAAAFQEIYGHGSAHRPTAPEDGLARLITAMLRGLKVPRWPSYRLPILRAVPR